MGDTGAASGCTGEFSGRPPRTLEDQPRPLVAVQNRQGHLSLAERTARIAKVHPRSSSYAAIALIKPPSPRVSMGEERVQGETEQRRILENLKFVAVSETQVTAKITHLGDARASAGHHSARVKGVIA